ncbi:hypothetical protein BCR33DRAFT_720079 [Rhizoclosmatium globosum]|uniref:Dipeptidyl-peptidase IV n=1 Tax=Rhizoclosmatium globosum TaxID=329046 RepID=A0A1Y2BXZ8_9FUNG|nr:hypothetical protein BCR33DRAFT_720079 [Rhizoclosmatium globosum]|eukprot:ORY39631.1 hypothetical protein BCR33DRAFT_720079 [Rhizoclosmatium globosum]
MSRSRSTTTTTSATAHAQAGSDDIEGGFSDTAPLVGIAAGPKRSSSNDDSDDNIGLDSNNKDIIRRFKFNSIRGRFVQTLRSPATVLALLALLLVAVVALSVQKPEGEEMDQTAAEGANKLLPFDMDALHSSLFTPELATREWVSGDKDGTYLVKDASSNLVLHHVDTKETTIIAAQADLVIDHAILQYSKYILSPTLKHILFASNLEKRWRHSYFGTYHIYDVEKKTLKLLTVKDDTPASTTPPKRDTTTSDPQDFPGKGKINLALFSPSGETVAWIRDNNMFLTSTTTETEVQLTTDGSFDTMNGIADWVYEEEVLSTSQAMWFSPDGSKLAYLKFRDDKVPSYKVQLFFHESGDGQQYPDEIGIKYPKAGMNNPVVTLHIADPSATSASARDIPIAYTPVESVFPDDDRLIVECKWLLEGDALMVRMMNRVQDHQRLFLIKAPEAGNANGTWIGTLVRDEKSVDGAWLTSLLQPIHVLPKSASRATPSYLELAEDSTGHVHIAHYNSISAKVPSTWLTKGDFEVTSIVHVDSERGVVYYMATKEGSMQRHLYSVKLGSVWGSSTKLTPPKGVNWPASVPSWKLEGGGEDGGILNGEVGWYDVSFSKGGGFFLCTYSGPDVPFQKIVSLYDSALNFPFKTNEKAMQNLKKYAMPRELFTTVPITNNILLNAKVVVPHDFSPFSAKKYPVLINVYGGPNSQTVAMRYGLSFETALAAAGYVIMYVDPRGTCCKGRAFRTVVSKQLGKIESADVVAAAQWIVGLGFVDPSRIAVWGWSYGGFLAAKVIEQNSPLIRTGISVAPVTDWKFYDSVYTERYMKTPLLNPKGYETSAVANMTGFKKAEFLLVHGTGDDNVHFQNSLSLIWKFTTEQVHNYQVQFYPDSDHSMSAANAYNELFVLMQKFLDTRFGMVSPASGTGKGTKTKRSGTGLEERHGIVPGIGLEWDLFGP